MPELNYDTASAAANTLREALLPFTFFLCFLGFVECVAHSRGDGERIVMYFIGVAVIAFLAANFPAGLTILTNSIDGMIDSHQAKTENLFWQILNAHLQETSSIWDVGNYILYGIVKLLQGIGKVGLVIVDLLQNVSILALVGISPILLGMLATSWTRSAGVRFLMTSGIIAMWSLGIALVDIVLYAVGNYIFGAAIGAGGAAGIGVLGAGTAAGVTLTTLAMPALLLVMAVACFVPIGLYLSIPLLMHAVMLGATTQPDHHTLSAGAGIAATGMGLAGAGATRSIATPLQVWHRAHRLPVDRPRVAGGSSPYIAPPAQGVAPPAGGEGGRECTEWRRG